MKRIITLLLALLLCLSFAALAKEAPSALVLPKLIGIAYFDDSYIGVEAGAEAFSVDAIWDGPTEASATEQARIIEDYLAQGVDAILLCPNDATALETTMEKVREAGRIGMNWDSTFDNSLVDYCIVSCDNVRLGQLLGEELAKSMNGTGEFAVLTSNLEVADHNIWMNSAIEYIAENYPDIKVVCDPIPTTEDQQIAYTKALELINTYPDLAGLLCVSSVNAPGAAQAIREQNLQDKIQIVGTSMPSQIGDYLEDGSVDSSVLWRPAYVTYVAMYVVSEVAKGNTISDGDVITMFDGTEYALKVNDGNIITPTDPIVFNLDNYTEFSF